jgi:hypothetical protein
MSCIRWAARWRSTSDRQQHQVQPAHVGARLPATEARLASSDPAVRACFLAKVMRQAKPDDVFRFVTWPTIADSWPRLERYLGQSRPFWAWLIKTWQRQARERDDGR